MLPKTLGWLTSAAFTSHVAFCWVTQGCLPSTSWLQLLLSTAEAGTFFVSEALMLLAVLRLILKLLHPALPLPGVLFLPLICPTCSPLSQVECHFLRKNPLEVSLVQYLSFNTLVTLVTFVWYRHWGLIKSVSSSSLRSMNVGNLYIIVSSVSLWLSQRRHSINICWMN